MKADRRRKEFLELVIRALDGDKDAERIVRVALEGKGKRGRPRKDIWERLAEEARHVFVADYLLSPEGCQCSVEEAFKHVFPHDSTEAHRRSDRRRFTEWVKAGTEGWIQLRDELEVAIPELSPAEADDIKKLMRWIDRLHIRVLRIYKKNLSEK